MNPQARSALNWFEIPVRDIDRAQRFYETLLGRPLRREAMGPQTLAVLPYDEGAVGGALLAGPQTPAPAAGGVTIYLNAGALLAPVLARLAEAGGRVVTPRVDLPGDMGCFVHFEDCEGNRVGLHASA